jgi:hypothetical protein
MCCRAAYIEIKFAPRTFPARPGPCVRCRRRWGANAGTVLFRTEPTTVLGVAALLDALAHNHDSESPIEMYVNAAGEMVNDFMRQLAKVLREAST